MLRVPAILVAMATGGVVAWMTLTAHEDTSAVTMVAEPPPMHDVLVASADIAGGAALDAGALVWRPWPAEAVHSAYITRQARPDADTAFEGAVVSRAVASGEPFREDVLAEPGVASIEQPRPPDTREIRVFRAGRGEVVPIR